MRNPCSVVARQMPSARPIPQAIPTESCPAKCLACAPYPERSLSSRGLPNTKRAPRTPSDPG